MRVRVKGRRRLFSGNVKAVNTLHVKQSLIKSRKPRMFVDRGLAWSETLIIHPVFATFETLPLYETNHSLLTISHNPTTNFLVR